jgi:hypothetical protein
LAVVIGTLFRSSAYSKTLDLVGNIADHCRVPSYFSGGFEIQFTQPRHLNKNG